LNFIALLALFLAQVVPMGEVGASPAFETRRDLQVTQNAGFSLKYNRVRLAQADGGTTTVAKSTLGKQTVARNAVLSGNQTKTVFRLELSKGVAAEVFTLADPYRVIIDLPDVTFSLPVDVGQKGHGLVSAFRFGLFAARKARVVLDTISPVRIDKAEMIRSASQSVVLELILVRTDQQNFGEGTRERRKAPSAGPAQNKTQSGKTRIKAKARAKAEGAPHKELLEKPVVVIDPGHGGIDPGALGIAKVSEKTIVLAVAKRLKKTLEQMDRYSVVMTRESDTYISLKQRVKRSEQNKADIFISLHADSISDRRYARSVSGATVYTLSSRASDEQARLMAEKENNADALAGIPVEKTDKAVDVRNILIDLLKRETANFSSDLSRALVEKLKGAVVLSRHPQRHADFMVLRQTQTPSVLIELGYMSNERDMKMMAGARWQLRAAKAIASAIKAYFKRRSRQAR